MKTFIFLFFVFALMIPTFGYGNKCQIEGNFYPPPQNAKIPTVDLNLDLPASERWTDILKPIAANISAMIEQVVNHFPSEIMDPILNFLEKNVDEYVSRLPLEFGEELKGIAKATNIDLNLIFMYNVFYEVEGMCTSIVGETSDGKIIHGRNLDFGLFFGMNNREWVLSELLRPILLNVNVKKGGKTLYSMVSYGGYIGCITCIKKGAFSASIDSRYDNNLDKFLLDWLTHSNDTSVFTSLAIREQMETNEDVTYAKALDTLSHKSYVGPSYIIMGGTKSGEGAVITIKPNNTNADIWELKDTESGWYVLETNYDHQDKTPFFDNRRAPAMDCLDNHIQQKNFNKTSLYNLLHAKPTRNRLTTYTALMSAEEGWYESSLQYCYDKNCPFW